MGISDREVAHHWTSTRRICSGRSPRAGAHETTVFRGLEERTNERTHTHTLCQCEESERQSKRDDVHKTDLRLSDISGLIQSSVRFSK